MKKIFIAAALISGFAGSAFAFDEGTDADANGVLSVEEMVAAYPDLTSEALIAIDTNADGVVDAQEWDAAKASGLL